MNDKNKNGFGLFGAIAVGVAAIATAVVMVNKKKKSKNKYFLKDELVKLPVFRKEEPPKKKEIVEEEDIFEDEDAIPTEEKKSFFSDAEEVSYEEDEEFRSESHAKPIVTPVKPEPAEEAVAEEPVAEEEVVEESVAEEVIEEPVEEEEVAEESVAEEVIEEPVAEKVVEEPVVEEQAEEAVAEEPVEEEVAEEPVGEDDTFVFESVVVGKQEETVTEAAATEEITEPVIAEPERVTPVMKEETPVRNTYYNEPVIDELIRAAMEEVTGKSSDEKIIENTTEEKPAEETVEDIIEEPVMNNTEEPVDDKSSEETQDEIDEEDDDIRAHESYYDWIYNVDEHYSVITDGKWVYCKSDDILTSTSVNKKGGRETIDIAETFKNRINVDGYCLLKYIGTEKDVVIPSVINGKPVVAAMNTFRSNQVIKTVTIPSSVLGLRRTFYSCYHLDKIIFEDGTRLLYELDSIMCGNNDMDSDTESTTVICSQEVADYLKGHYKLGCPVVFKVK